MWTLDKKVFGEASLHRGRSAVHHRVSNTVAAAAGLKFTI